MKDRFKFRAWDGERMINFDTFSIHWKKVRGKDPEPYITFENSNLSDKPVKLGKYVDMQCTGLKDKNDTLIYEGDICRNDDGLFIIEFGRFIYDDGEYSHSLYGPYARVLKNISGCLYPENCIPLLEYPFWGFEEKCKSEVIGDIHRNPELLESK